MEKRSSVCGKFEEEPLPMETIEYRNQTSHTDNEKLAEKIYRVLPDITNLYERLLKNLKDKS